MKLKPNPKNNSGPAGNGLQARLKRAFCVSGLLLGTSLAFLAPVNSSAQMNSWVMPPKRFDATSNPMTVTNPLYPTAPSSGSYFVANGAYDQSGNLLFFVKDDIVYNSSGGMVGPLGNINGGYSTTYNFLCGEIAIVPVPGNCKAFYVIYAKASNNSQTAVSDIGYVTVDCTTGAPSVIYGPSGGTSANEINIVSLPSLADVGGINSAIAVSPRMGSGPSSTYYLYYTTYTGGATTAGVRATTIKYATINSSGITTTGVIGGALGYEDLNWSPELELSPDGKWLAAAGVNSSNQTWVDIFQLSGGTSVVGSAQSTSYYSGIGGLEFVDPGTGTPNLYVAGLDASGSPAFDKINVTTGAPTHLQSFLTTSSPLTMHNFANTFLEYGKNGYLYGFDGTTSSPQLIEYNTVSNTIHALLPSGANPFGGNPISLYATYPYQTYPTIGSITGIYTLPDQIDGYNYSNYATPSSLTGMWINGTAAQNICNGSFQQINSCNGIDLVATTDGTSYSTTLKITPLGGGRSGCTALSNSGRGWMQYNKPIRFPDKAVDITTLEDNFGNTLTNVGGYYQITLTISDACGNTSSMNQFVNILSAPSLDLQINAVGGVLSPLSHNPLAPVTIGDVTAGFSVNNSLGGATNMNVQLTDYNTGANLIWQNVPITSLPSTPAQSLNNYCVNNSVWGAVSTGGAMPCGPSLMIGYSGHTTYFQKAGAAGFANSAKEYKLQVTLSDACGTSVDYSYVVVTSATMRPTGIEELAAEGSGIVVYPNPASDKVQVAIKSQQADVYDIALYDMTGRLVKTIADKTNLEAGAHTIDVNTTDLQTGIYSWRISSQGINHAGLVTITK